MQAVRWWKEGKIDKILDYCQEDVALTLGLYVHGRDNGYIYFQNKAKKLVHLPVDWSNETVSKTMGLKAGQSTSKP
jgi:DEAD/DEAH box helicase domain-containing protein